MNNVPPVGSGTGDVLGACAKGEVTVQLRLLPTGTKAPSPLYPASQITSHHSLVIHLYVLRFSDDPTTSYSTLLPASTGSVNASDEAVYTG